jgi:flagellar hook-associated protein 2
MGIRMPGVTQYGALVDQLIQVEKQPIEVAKRRKDKVVEEKKEVEKLQKFLLELDSAMSSLKSKSDFYKMKVESSHPDIIEGTVNGFAQPGSYEFEVRGLAKNEKELAYGFPDKDKTEVGFGYMTIQREDQEVPSEIIIEPGSTLQDVVQKINELDIGVRALVINTKYYPESYRLLVISESSGTEAKVTIDEDTTFLEFKEQVSGRNLDVLFEDVPITDEDNTLDELIENVIFYLKRSEPGTRIQVSIAYDIDKTLGSIKNFVDKYNQIVLFAAEQSKNPQEGQPGLLSGDSSIRQIMRGLQQSLFPGGDTGGKYTTLSSIGITTNPKTGELMMDESKVRAALTENYEAVARIFIRSKFGDGVGERLAATIKGYRDPEVGVVRSRLRGLDKVIKNQDQDIERRERQIASKEEQIKRRFSALESQVNNMQAQGQYLKSRFGNQESGSQGGG